jgi:hypothetical protein
MRHRLFTGLGVVVALLAFSVPASAAVLTSPPKPDATQSAPATSTRASVGIFTFALPSARSIDIAHETVTLPLYEGRTKAGDPTWYIVTESSSMADATKRGVTYSPKLLNAIGTAAVQNGHLDHGTLVFAGTVNFGLHWSLVPGPNGFPPKSFSYGARGDAHYSPVVQVDKGVVINAPQVANKTGLSGSVVAIDYGKRTVTLSLLAGWVDGQFTLYLHTDASLDLVAALEHSTYAPNLNAAPGFASDDPTSARAAIIPVVNGIRGDSDPMRQGLESALLGQGDPLNVAQEQPSDPVHYSPLWDVTPVKWTDAAIAAGLRVQLHSQDDVIAEAKAGNIVGALGTTPNVGLGGITAPGAISNCPIIVVFPG